MLDEIGQRLVLRRERDRGNQNQQEEHPKHFSHRANTLS
jgi:hypothetical protein